MSDSILHQICCSQQIIPSVLSYSILTATIVARKKLAPF